MENQHEYTQINLIIDNTRSICQASFHDDAKCKEFQQAGAKWRGHEVLGCSCVRFLSLPTSRHDAGLMQD